MNNLEKKELFYTSKINYYKYEWELDNQVFRTYFIVDLKNLSSETTQEILENFEEFQVQLLREYYFCSKNNNPLFLYFLCDENLKENEKIERIKDNTNYAYKDFFNKQELKLILNRIKEQELKKYTFNVKIEDQTFKMSNFNLLYGSNEQKKNLFFKQLQQNGNAKVFNLLDVSTNLPIYSIEYLNYMRTILKNTSTKTAFFERLANIIQYARENNFPIVLDNFGWFGLDDLNQIKTIDILAENALETQTTITACQKHIAELVRTRVYKPNIIHLNKR